jgi:5-methylcytosine-specific restriction endonuclease McrA
MRSYLTSSVRIGWEKKTGNSFAGLFLLKAASLMTNLKKALKKVLKKATQSSNNSSSSKNNSNTSKEPKLTIELVPSTAWFTNVRSEVSKAKWDKIRRKSYKSADYKCEICSESGLDQGFNHPVECHEIWNYNDVKKEQKLIGFISLCPKCHRCKHPGLASIRGEGELVREHLMKVNGMTIAEMEAYFTKVTTVWNKRSEYQWDLDITYVEDYLKG